MTEQLRAQFEEWYNKQEALLIPDCGYESLEGDLAFLAFIHCAKIKDVEIKRLKLALKYQDDREGHIGTHSPECYKFGYRHYECALREIAALKAQVDQLMLEYCPNEMTESQITEWHSHQKVAVDMDEHDKEVEIKALENASKHFYDNIDYSDVSNSDDLNEKLKFASDHCQRLADELRRK